MEALVMWVFCCGMQRSGSTLQYNIAKDMVEALNIGEGLGYIEAQEFAPFSRKYLDAGKYYIIKSHAFIPEYQTLCKSNQALALYTYRDMRDVILSLMRINSTPFYKVLLGGAVQEMIQNDALWSSTNGTLRSKYEEFVNDLEGEAIRVARHLNITINKNLVDQIIQNNSMDAQKTKIGGFNWENSEEDSRTAAYMPGTLLHSNHIQSGKIAEWKTAFSSGQIILIELLTYQWLAKNGYEVSHPQIVYRMKSLGKLLSVPGSFWSAHKRTK
jgi:hypothetical protein